MGKLTAKELLQGKRENPTSEAVQFYKGAWPSFTALELKISVQVGVSLFFSLELSLVFSCHFVSNEAPPTRFCSSQRPW